MDIQTLAENHFRRFVHVILRLLSEGKPEFDLIVGGGDSGIAMVKFVELIYANRGLSFPKTLILPVYRHADEEETIPFDNSIFVPEVKNVLSSTIKLRRVLFVDDEIGSGSVAKSIFQLILFATNGEAINKPLEYCVVAEDHGFQFGETKNVIVKFYPYSKKTNGLWAILSRMPNAEIVNEVSKILPPAENQYKYVTNILLGLPVKEFAKGKPRFTRKYLRLAERKFSQLPLWQSNFQKQLGALIVLAMQNEPGHLLLGRGESSKLRDIHLLL